MRLTTSEVDRRPRCILPLQTTTRCSANATGVRRVTQRGRERLLDVGEVKEILDAVAQVCTPVPLRFLWRPRLKDPADEMVLETAVNGGADWLVTFDVRHLAKAARDFGLRVLRPSEAWKEVVKDAKK